MSYLKTIIYRWDKEELGKWSSMKKISYLLLPFLVYIFINDAAEILLWACMEVFLRSAGEGTISFFGHYGATIRGIIGGVAILLGVLSVWPAVKNEIRVPGGVKGDVITSYAFLAAFAFCVSVSINIFFYQAGFTASSGSYTNVYEAQYGVQFLIGLVLYGAISPIAEEAVFRGLIYNRMKRCFGFPAAIIFSSVLFGAYHGNIVQASYGMILGVMIAYAYEIYGTFAAPVLFHAVANISVYTLTYQNSLSAMNRKIALVTGTITLTAAVFIAFYIKRKLHTEKK